MSQIEEIKTVELEKKRMELTRKIAEVKEIVTSAKIHMDAISEEENNIWYSSASKNLYDKFLSDYRKYLELEDSFQGIIDFLTQVNQGYEDLNQSMIENIGKIEDTKVE